MKWTDEWDNETFAQGTTAHCTGGTAVVSIDGTAGIDVSFQGDIPFPVHVLFTSVDGDDVLSLSLDEPAARLLLEGLLNALPEVSSC